MTEARRVECCANCRFARPYKKPDPLPPPQRRSILFGLIQWEDGPDDVDHALYNMKQRRHENSVGCVRHPKTIEKPKQAWCGEYQRQESAE